MTEPSIQGISAPSRGYASSDRYSLGQAVTFKANASNPFYTTKVSGLVISATTFTAPTLQNQAGSLEFEFSGSPDLSEVMVGNYLNVRICEDLANTSIFKITAVDNSAKTITVEARNGATNASSSGTADTMPFYGAYSIECTADTTGLAVSISGYRGADFEDMILGEGRVYDTISEVTMTAGSVELKLL